MDCRRQSWRGRGWDAGANGLIVSSVMVKLGQSTWADHHSNLEHIASLRNLLGGFCLLFGMVPVCFSYPGYKVSLRYQADQAVPRRAEFLRTEFPHRNRNFLLFDAALGYNRLVNGWVTRL